MSESPPRTPILVSVLTVFQTSFSILLIELFIFKWLMIKIKTNYTNQILLYHLEEYNYFFSKIQNLL